MKTCKKCRRVLPVGEFYMDKRHRDGLQSWCKTCTYESTKVSQSLGRVLREIGNSGCSSYFEDQVVKWLHSNVCSHGFKVDIAWACLTPDNEKPYVRWVFHINKNTIPDFFALVGFDSRYSLTPLHFWLIPGKDINNSVTVGISKSMTDKWSHYEIPIELVMESYSILIEKRGRVVRLEDLLPAVGVAYSDATLLQEVY